MARFRLSCTTAKAIRLESLADAGWANVVVVISTFRGSCQSDSDGTHLTSRMIHMNEAFAQNELVSHEELAQRLPPGTPDWVTSGLLSITGMAELNRYYAKLGNSLEQERNLFEQALDQLGVQVHVTEEEMRHIPKHGAVIVVSNHPFGGIDGLSLGATLLRHRRDVRIVTNSILSRITKLAPWFLEVSVFPRTNQPAVNARQLRAALAHLATGGMLVVFPAGEVAHYQPQQGGVVDPDWNEGVAVLARRSGAVVVPCYFDGQNGPLFHAAGLLHPLLRTALLPRELLARRCSRVTFHVGRSVSAESMRQFEDNRTLTAWLRMRTYALAEASTPQYRGRPAHPVAAPGDASAIHTELSLLPEDNCLLEQGPYQVFLTRQAAIPQTLDEIGRLRELTFRAVGEGTGAARDLDKFDGSYHHLVLYDSEKRCLIGAYRLAFCDARISQDGVSGLYTQSLFQYRAPMRKELSCAIELGRSFIRLEYQRKPLALAMLWRGIGAVLCRHPKYRRLIGPVSISNSYRGSSRRMMVAFLEELRSDPALSKLVVPRRRVTAKLNDAERHVFASSCKSVRSLSRLVGELDGTGQGVPVLLERYLELGARVLALNLDPSFSNCIDALVVVDLDNAPEALLKRFMGAPGFSAYQAARAEYPALKSA